MLDSKCSNDSLTDNYNNIPSELKDKRIWLNYKEEYTPATTREQIDANKQPRDYKGRKCSYTSNVCNMFFDKACESVKEGYTTGIGIALTDKGYAVLDYDNVIKEVTATGDIVFIDKETEQRILRDIDILRSYTEISPSGTGLHVYIQANTKVNTRATGIEIYTNHFMRVTGRRVFNYEYIRECTEELQQILKLYKIDTEDVNTLKFKDSYYDDLIKQKFKYVNTLKDREILDKMFTHTTKGEYYKRLYNNEINDKEYIDFKTKKLKDLKRRGKINQETYDHLLSKIDVTASGKAFTLIIELLDFCYGDVKAVKRLFKASKLCKSDYLKVKYKDNNNKKTKDKIDKYFIPKAIDKYKNYRDI